VREDQRRFGKAGKTELVVSRWDLQTTICVCGKGESLTMRRGESKSFTADFSKGSREKRRGRGGVRKEHQEKVRLGVHLLNSEKDNLRGETGGWKRQYRRKWVCLAKNIGNRCSERPKKLLEETDRRLEKKEKL